MWRNAMKYCEVPPNFLTIKTTEKEASNMTENGEFKLLTVTEVGNILNIGRASAYALVRQTGFPVIRIGRHFRVPEDALYRWINSQVSD